MSRPTNDQLLANHAAATARIRRTLPTSQGGLAAETAYAAAARACVQAGLHRPLKKKYRKS